MTSKTPIESLEEMTAVACAPGNYNFDPYMHGMANGMIFALSVLKDEEPVYLEAPKIWLGDKPDTAPPSSILPTH